MANISSLLDTIKNAIYGRDMRSALHDAIKAVNDDTETRLKRSGGTMTGGITMNGNKVTSSATPSTANDYTNKKYVDGEITEIYDDLNEQIDALDEKIADSNKLSYAINDSDGEILLDSDGNPIIGRMTVGDVISNLTATIENLKQHAIVDSTF